MYTYGYFFFGGDLCGKPSRCRGSELLNTSAAEEEIALLREEVAELRSRVARPKVRR